MWSWSCQLSCWKSWADDIAALEPEELEDALTACSASSAHTTVFAENASAVGASGELSFTDLLLGAGFDLGLPAWEQDAVPQPKARAQLVGLNPVPGNPGNRVVTTGMGAAFLANLGQP